MSHWPKGEKTVRFLISRGRLETVDAVDLAGASDALTQRATRRLDITARSALRLGDIEGSYSAAYDAYRIAAESILAAQGLRATCGDGSHVAVEDAVSAQFASDIPAFAKPTFERLRRTRHSVQYFDVSAAPVTKADAAWAIDKAAEAIAGVNALLSARGLERFA